MRSKPDGVVSDIVFLGVRHESATEDHHVSVHRVPCRILRGLMWHLYPCVGRGEVENTLRRGLLPPSSELGSIHVCLPRPTTCGYKFFAFLASIVELVLCKGQGRQRSLATRVLASKVLHGCRLLGATIASSGSAVEKAHKFSKHHKPQRELCEGEWSIGFSCQLDSIHHRCVDIILLLFVINLSSTSVLILEQPPSLVGVC